MKAPLVLALAAALVAGPAVAQATRQVIVTSGATLTLPSDWDSAHGTVEGIGAGAAGGSNGPPNWSGGGGAYARKANPGGNPGQTVSIQVGSGDTCFISCANFKAAGAITGYQGAGSGMGGQASASVGDVTYSGGDGIYFTTFGSAAGGGGAAGPNGPGGSTLNSAGGTADNGTVPASTSGTEWGTAGAGGGGSNVPGASYGGGGSNNGGGQAGAGGLLVLTYIPRHRASSGVF